MISIRPIRASLLRSTAAGLLLLFASCAGGGGSTGTGITTAQGTIAGDTQTASRAATGLTRGASWIARWIDWLDPARAVRAATGPRGVVVTIEGTTLSTESNASGFFSLAGSFGGPVTLVFSANDGHPPARLQVNVPTGGTLTLDDVRLDGPEGQARPDAQHLDFEGVVSATNCSGGSLSMVSNFTPDDGNLYPVDVAGAALRDSQGNAIQCGDLGSGDVLTVQGDIRSDGGIQCNEANRRKGGGGGGGPGGGMP